MVDMRDKGRAGRVGVGVEVGVGGGVGGWGAGAAAEEEAEEDAEEGDEAEEDVMGDAVDLQALAAAGGGRHRLCAHCRRIYWSASGKTAQCKNCRALGQPALRYRGYGAAP